LNEVVSDEPPKKEFGAKDDKEFKTVLDKARKY